MPKNVGVYISYSRSRCSSNKLALAWLRDEFEPATKLKAGRARQLSLVDGHGSHVTTKITVEYR